MAKKTITLYVCAKCSLPNQHVDEETAAVCNACGDKQHFKKHDLRGTPIVETIEEVRAHWRSEETDYPSTDMEYGKSLPSSAWGRKYRLDEFLVGAGCNVFHYDDVQAAAHFLGFVAAMRYYDQEGRTRYAEIEFELSGEVIGTVGVRACGYGTGDFVRFSKDFYDDLEAQVLIHLSEKHARDNYHHFKDRWYDARDDEEMSDEARKYLRDLMELYHTRMLTLQQDTRSFADLELLTMYNQLTMARLTNLHWLRQHPAGSEVDERMSEDGDEQYSERKQREAIAFYDAAKGLESYDVVQAYNELTKETKEWFEKWH